MTASRIKQPAPQINGNGTAPEDIAEDVPQVEVSKIDVERLQIPILGTSPLVMNRFSEKAKRQMLDAMQGRKTPKRAKDPEAEYQAAFYRFADADGGGYGFPVTAFKKATVGGARFYGKDVKMTELRQFMFFVGDVGLDGVQLVRIVGEPRMREDVVRVGNKSADLHYRPEFPQWSAVLNIIYVKSALTRGSVLSLVDAAGMGIGVGEWRPERHGTSGCYRIDPDREIEVVEVER